MYNSNLTSSGNGQGILREKQNTTDGKQQNLNTNREKSKGSRNKED